jgi:Phage integrase family
MLAPGPESLHSGRSSTTLAPTRFLTGTGHERPARRGHGGLPGDPSAQGARGPLVVPAPIREPGDSPPETYAVRPRFPGSGHRRLSGWYRPEEPIGHTTFSTIWRRLLSRARVRYRKPHGLRHTYATRLIAEAVDHGQDGEAILHYVSKQLGHSSIKITVDYYGHLVPTRRRVIVNRLDNGPPRPAQSATNPRQPEDCGPISENTT